MTNTVRKWGLRDPKTELWVHEASGKGSSYRMDSDPQGAIKFPTMTEAIMFRNSTLYAYKAEVPRNLYAIQIPEPATEFVDTIESITGKPPVASQPAPPPIETRSKSPEATLLDLLTVCPSIVKDGMQIGPYYLSFEKINQGGAESWTNFERWLVQYKQKIANAIRVTRG